MSEKVVPLPQRPQPSALMQKLLDSGIEPMAMEQMLQVVVENGSIVLKFGMPIEGMCLDVQQARDMGVTLISYAALVQQAQEMVAQQQPATDQGAAAEEPHPGAPTEH